MKCKTKFCRREARKGKRICTTCDKKKWRAKFPMKACFQTLRQNARRRGKPFKLTFAEFERFCRETKYMAGKGRTKKSFTIDCIENAKGYVVDNIRKITQSANAKKGTKTLIYDYRTGYAKVV